MFFKSKQNKEKCSEKQAKVISFLNQKGGVGKTTMAFHSAFALKERGYKVLCLDLDPQGNLELMLRKKSNSFREEGLFQLLINTIRELKALHKGVLLAECREHCQGIDFFGPGHQLSGFELTVAGIRSPRQLILKNFLHKSGLLDEYDYIVIDGPPTLGLLVVNILCTSDGVVIPFHPDQFSKQGLEKFHDTLDDIESMGIGGAPVVIGHLPNLVSSRRKQEKEDFHSIEDLIQNDLKQEKILQGLPNKALLARANGLGRSIFSYQSKEAKEIQHSFMSLVDAVEERMQ